MEHIKIIIEKSADHLNAYAEKLAGIYGAGDTMAEVEASIEQSVALFKECNEVIPPELAGDYTLVYVFHVPSFLSHYDKILSRAALSRLTDIDQRQLGHYIQGLHKPRKDKAKKIEQALHQLGRELLAVELV